MAPAQASMHCGPQMYLPGTLMDLSPSLAFEQAPPTTSEWLSEHTCLNLGHTVDLSLQQ